MAAAHASDGSGFFEENYDRIHRYVRRMVRDPGEAEDLTQEAFLRAHRERDAVKDSSARLAWLYRIATHAALDQLRQRASRAARQSGVDAAELDPPDLSAPSLEQGLEQRQMSACVQRYLVNLSDNDRAVILLHDCHGLSGPEIAAMLDVPLSTVKVRLLRARERLRAALESSCTLSLDERGVLVCEPKK